MKYVVILGDGMADYPIESLGNKTPIEIAKKPNIDSLSPRSEIGLVKTIPNNMKPGSDTANLSVLGYDPVVYYTGRSPLEAISMGIDLQPQDIAVRTNLVTLSSDKEYQDKVMIDYSAGEISTKETKILIEYLNDNLQAHNITLYPGVSYRNCMVVHNTELGTEITPPHDITNKAISNYLPKGLNGQLFLDLMQQSYELLAKHPINIKRTEQGKNPANSIWLWGEGVRPSLEPFEVLYGKKGAIISAVDLLKGIGIAAGMKICEVEGVTGTIDTNYIGKAQACIDVLQDGVDFVYLHIEAPDECSHQGDLDGKIKSIENIDSQVVSRVIEGLDNMGEEYSILVLPDHPTPLSTRTHASDPVPYMLYRSSNEEVNNNNFYNEKVAKNNNILINSGTDLMNRFFNNQINQHKGENDGR